MVSGSELIPNERQGWPSRSRAEYGIPNAPKLPGRTVLDINNITIFLCAELCAIATIILLSAIYKYNECSGTDSVKIMTKIRSSWTVIENEMHWNWYFFLLLFFFFTAHTHTHTPCNILRKQVPPPPPPWVVLLTSELFAWTLNKRACLEKDSQLNVLCNILRVVNTNLESLVGETACAPLCCCVHTAWRWAWRE